MSYTMLQCGIDYINGLRRRGKPVRQAGVSVQRAAEFFDAREVESLKVADFEDFADSLAETGIKPSTVHRELTTVKAALRYAKKRERIAIVPSCELPAVIFDERRPLTEDEFRLVIQQEMSDRLRRFFWVAYHTGARSRAIEEWTWDRCDLVRDSANFNVPGRLITNKRRVDGFPIGADFKALLLEWKATAKDEYVIGLGPSGRCTSTYHEAAHVVRVKAGLSDPALVPRHCMRKLFVTELVDRMIKRNGAADMEIIGALTGDNPDMLRRHYLKLNTEPIRSAAELRSAPL